MAVHLPGGRWILVDSCPNSAGEPANLAYLKGLGVDTNTDVSLVVASHWHLDHVQGMAEIVQECRGAEPCISAALHTRELLAYAGAVQYLGDAAPRAVAELRRLANEVAAENPTRFLTLAQARMTLLEVEHAGVTSSVVALSPSPASVSAAVSHLARSTLVPDREVDVPRPDHNAAAVVLLVRSGKVGVLLASDLERESDPKRGWEAAVEATGIGDYRCQVLKVPHHGSVNGDTEVMWRRLLRRRPIGLLTHFHNGSVHLPDPAQLQTLATRFSGLFSTSGPAWVPSRLTATDAAELLVSGRPIRWASPGLGHVRARIRPGQEKRWRISLCGPAAVVEASPNSSAVTAGVSAT